MSFIDRHSPKTINDLVFRHTEVAKTIHEYAAGKRTKHLLLYGPPGSGKSEAARILVDTLCPETAGTFANEHINPMNFGKDGFIRVTNQWNAQMNLCGAPRGFVVIDEVDWFVAKMMNELRGFIDDTRVGTIICTTNHLHALDDPIKSRFTKLHLEWPTVQNWLPRAKAIMAAEGHDLTDEQIMLLLDGFVGSGRDLIEWLEGLVLRLPAVSEVVSPNLSVTTGRQTASSNPPNQPPPTLTIAT